MKTNTKELNECRECGVVISKSKVRCRKCQMRDRAQWIRNYETRGINSWRGGVNPLDEK